MKQSNQMFFPLFQVRARFVLLLFTIGLIGLVSCSKEQASEKQTEEYLLGDNPDLLLSDEEMEVAISLFSEKSSSNSLAAGSLYCPTGTSAIPPVDLGPTAALPFHQNTGLTVTWSRQGYCQGWWFPCLFVGYVTITTLPGQTGNYRVILPFLQTQVIPVNNLSGTINVPFARPQLPLAVVCSNGAKVYIEAQDAAGNWIRIREFRLLCYPCNIGNPSGL